MQPNDTHLRRIVGGEKKTSRRQASLRLVTLLLVAMPLAGGLGHARAMGPAAPQRFISGARASDERSDYLATLITMADKRPPQRRATTNTHGAMLPPRTDPWMQLAPLNANDAAPSDLFGRVVAVDGSIAVVGAPDNNNRVGAAYVFMRTGPTWSQAAKLSASDGANGDFFGATVAVDRDTIVIGAPFGNNGTGAAYIFTCEGSSWTQGAKLIANDGASGDIFGYSVATQGDTIVVGAPNVASGTGAAYVFKRTGPAWVQQAKLNASDGMAGDIFGSVVAVSGDTAVVGADFKNNWIGAVYLFARRGMRWEQQAELSAGDGASGDQFGDAVAVDRDTVVVGAVYNSGATGAAYVFTRKGNSWEQQAKLTASDGAAGDGLGAAVAVDGDTIVAGAPFANIGVGNYETGAAYVFTRAAGNWVQQAKLAAGDGASWDFFGAGVGASGQSIVVGAPFNKDMGTVYAFAR